jgi:hypothetical protein
MKRRKRQSTTPENIADRARKALEAGEDLSESGIAVITRNERTTISIYGTEAAAYDRNSGDVTLNGSIRCTRKSCRYMNMVVMAFTHCKVESHFGRWYLRDYRKKKLTDFTDRTVSLFLMQETSSDIPVMRMA